MKNAKDRVYEAALIISAIGALNIGLATYGYDLIGQILLKTNTLNLIPILNYVIGLSGALTLYKYLSSRFGF